MIINIDMPATYAGLRIVFSPHAVKRTFDWSGCRSPARAMRRWKRGYPQRVEVTLEPQIYRLGDTAVVHPDLRPAIEAAFRKDVEWAVSRFREARGS